MSFGHRFDELIADHGSGLVSKAEHWERVRLSKIARVINGFPFPSNGFNSQKGEPVIRIRDITAGQVGTYFNGKADEAPRVVLGDLVIGMDGDFNCRLWPGETALMNQRVCKVVPNEAAYSNRFLAYVLPGYLKLVNDHTSAITVKHLSSATVQDFPLPLPPRAEQDRLVSKLDELFSRIEEGERALERLLKLVERYRQSVLKAAVTGELSRAWRRRRKGKLDSGEMLLQRILNARRAAWEKAELDKMKAKGQKPTNQWRQKYIEPSPPDTTNLPELPEGWTWASLAQLAWASSYGTSQKCSYATNGPAVLRIPNIRDGQFDFEDIKYSTADLELDASDYLTTGDLLVIRTNGSDDIIGIGSVLMSEPAFPCYFASYLIRFRLVLPGELAGWINFCWQSHVVRKFVNEHKASSAGQYNVSQSSLRELCLPIPPAKERSEIVDEVALILSKSDAATDSVVWQRKRARVLKGSVLRAAFSGALVLQEPNDEPASVLLKRIADNSIAVSAKPKRGPSKKKKKA